MVHHGAGLRQITRDGEFVKKFIEDYQSVSLSLRERAMLDYAAKPTREPWNMVEDDVKALKKEGFTDVVPTSTVWRIDSEWNWKASGKTMNRFCHKSLSAIIRQNESIEIFSLFKINYFIAAL